MQDRRTHAKLPIKIMRPYLSDISISKKNLWHCKRNWIKGPNLIHTTFDIPWTMFFFQLTIHSTDETRNYACLFAWRAWLLVPISRFPFCRLYYHGVQSWADAKTLLPTCWSHVRVMVQCRTANFGRWGALTTNRCQHNPYYTVRNPERISLSVGDENDAGDQD